MSTRKEHYRLVEKTCQKLLILCLPIKQTIAFPKTEVQDAENSHIQQEKPWVEVINPL